MDTLLTLMGGLVLVCCLAYFNNQDAPRRQDRLFESAERMPMVDAEADDPLTLSAVVESAGRPIES